MDNRDLTVKVGQIWEEYVAYTDSYRKLLVVKLDDRGFTIFKNLMDRTLNPRKIRVRTARLTLPNTKSYRLYKDV